MSVRSQALAAALSSVTAITLALAQPVSDSPSIMQATISRTPYFSVSGVGADGTIQLRPSSAIPEIMRDNLASAFAEGHYLLLTTDSKQPSRHRLLRVIVTDIAEGSAFTLKTSERAASRVRENDLATLFRPSAVTTARLRALPDEILIESAPPDENDVVDARELQARGQSINNLKMIGLAMHNYHSVFNEFPPAVIYGPDGKPWHSWRVLLLPYLEQAGLYNAYDFSQPWDSPKNKALIDQMPAVYRDPIYGVGNAHDTNYAVLVGPTAVFVPEGAKQIDAMMPPLGKGGLGLQTITDGTSNTLLAAPVEPERKIPWTKPEDIDVGPAFAGFGKPKGIAAPYTFLGPGRGKAAPVLFGDGSVRMISSSINVQVMSALLSRAGGEVIAFDAIPAEPSPGTLLNERRTLKIRSRDRKTTAVIEVDNSRIPLEAVPGKRLFRKAR